MEKIMNHTIQKNLLDCQQPTHAKSFGFSWSRALLGVFQLLHTIKKYNSIAKQRQALLNLTDEQLDDIGVSREEAIQEAGKPFWK